MLMQLCRRRTGSIAPANSARGAGEARRRWAISLAVATGISLLVVGPVVAAAVSGTVGFTVFFDGTTGRGANTLAYSPVDPSDAVPRRQPRTSCGSSAWI